MEIRFIGHCYEHDKHDKIWGYLVHNGTILSSWGRRKGSMSYKQYEYEFDAREQARKKQNKGYHSTHMSHDNTQYLPDDFESGLLMAILGNVKFRI